MDSENYGNSVDGDLKIVWERPMRKIELLQADDDDGDVGCL